MKIRTFKEIENGVYKVKIHAEDYSELENELMANYGEPEINTGGYYEAAAAVAALLDLSFIANPASTGFVAGFGSVYLNPLDVLFVANPSEDDTVTIGDGTNSVIFEFGVSLTVGDVLVDNSVDAPTTLANLETAIGASALTVSTVINAGTITITHTDAWADVTIVTSNAVDITVSATVHVAPLNTTVSINDGTNTVIFEIKRSTEPLINLNALPVDNDTDVATTLAAFDTAVQGSTLNVTTGIAGSILTLTHVLTDANFIASTLDGDVSLVDTSFVSPTEPTFTLPNNLELIKSDSPFVQGFDERDSADAEAKADLWTAKVTVKLKAAVTALRALDDTFTGETVETY
jgi:hypothetical protein